MAAAVAVAVPMPDLAFAQDLNADRNAIDRHGILISNVSRHHRSRILYRRRGVRGRWPFEAENSMRITPRR